MYYYTGDDEYYLYRLNSDGELVYKGTDSKKEDRTVANKVERAKFAEGYLVYVKEDDKVYKVKVGTTSSTYICSEFEKFKYDDEFVIEVVGDKRVEFD